MTLPHGGALLKMWAQWISASWPSKAAKTHAPPRECPVSINFFPRCRQKLVHDFLRQDLEQVNPGRGEDLAAHQLTVEQQVIVIACPLKARTASVSEE
mmetsp:Transcript_26761/g.69706  ORF Transcript_26761/g.69706 Transcript_26761/m.69706 type:complete len:98 (-) Transcript_26761:127-420(-)